MRRIALVGLLAGLAQLAAGLPAAQGAPERGLKNESFTVIAVVDTGINPYHDDFRRPDLTTHPSSYIDGFPKSAKALNLTFGLPTLMDSQKKDEKVWKGAKAEQLYWIPGTNIIGAVGPFDGMRNGPILPDGSHGTGTSSLAAGMIHGPKSERVLLVHVKGFVDGLKWAARQPWIDIVTNSWGPPAGVNPLLPGVADAAYEAVEAGKVVCFASGNTTTPTLHDESAGPSWIVIVGAASEVNRGEYYYTSYPNDILGHAKKKAASDQLNDGEMSFGGTSAASPSACGLFARTLAEARARLGDRREGPHGGVLLVGPKHKEGPLDDGVLTRVELEDAMQSTAQPASTMTGTSDPTALPALPLAAFIRGGYGIVDSDTAKVGLDVILGREPRPERQLEDQWYITLNTIRDAYWGEPPN